ncbi:MAG: hypothetical protein ACLPKI_22190 [Streptosporangiaceae bacterium]
MATERAPKGSGPAGRRLWNQVTARYVLEPHETELLRRAVVAADQLDALESRLPDPDAAKEWRLTAITLARLLAGMKLPQEAIRPARPVPGSQPSHRVGRAVGI